MWDGVFCLAGYADIKSSGAAGGLISSVMSILKTVLAPISHGKPFFSNQIEASKGNRDRRS